MQTFHASYPSEHDDDPLETSEWIESLETLSAVRGTDRAAYILSRLQAHARELGVSTTGVPYSAYRNTIPLVRQPPYPGDADIESRINALVRWNALAMVVRANQSYGELGGHIASFASAAEIFEVGFNHFFRASTADGPGDLVYFQPHSAPGVYARSFLEGRLSEQDLANFRQEVPGPGLCSYPHPWLMKHYWQLPTGSMGIGPLSAIYQARFMRYLQARGLAQTQRRHVWGIFGDGEMDEPESLAGLTLAAREQLDNLTFIVNCNLQRLDGPVRGNGQIIQELESLFIGAGWNVIKVLWGSEWDALFARDRNNVLLRRFSETVDGQYQKLGSRDGDYNRHTFFESDPESAALVSDMSDAQIHALKRGGHDIRKLYAAFATAREHSGQPTVILAKTKKGFGMGGAGESRMGAHQAKKLDIDALMAFRDRFDLPLNDTQVKDLHFHRPPEDSPEIRYLKARRELLGGYLPKRSTQASNKLQTRPPLSEYAGFALTAEQKSMSTTMAAVRLLSGLLRDKDFGARLVPIVADEARTFGMNNLFRQVGIYSPQGQLYEPEDSGSMLYYRESSDGQLLEEGITEAGAMSSWTAAATAYSAHDIELLPVYIYYSMFGFQRIGDLIWAAADQRARGFLLGATSGKTTLSGEGLQHQDGASQLVASTIPNCRSYDPCFAHELAVIMEYGMQRMLDEQRDEFFYITVMNENYPQRSLDEETREGIIRGIYRMLRHGAAADDETAAGTSLDKTTADSTLASKPVNASVNLLGSGAILREVIAAAEILHEQFGISSDVFSVTSYTELARDAANVERNRRIGRINGEQRSYLQIAIENLNIPIVAVSDYVRAYAQQIAPYLQSEFIALGTDGFGRSANRNALRDFFEVDRRHIALAAIDALVRRGELYPSVLEQAREQLAIAPNIDAPWAR